MELGETSRLPSPFRIFGRSERDHVSFNYFDSLINDRLMQVRATLDRT